MTIAVVELTDPRYDGANRTATYTARPLADFREEGPTLQETPTDAASLLASFGAAHLFIDDCPGTTIYCCKFKGQGVYEVVGSIAVPQDWVAVRAPDVPYCAPSYDPYICDDQVAECNDFCIVVRSRSEC